MYIDLVGDYAGKELFLIEGDSLLRQSFEDERIDFDGESPLVNHAFPRLSYLSLFPQHILNIISHFFDASWDWDANLPVAVSRYLFRTRLAIAQANPLVFQGCPC